MSIADKLTAIAENVQKVYEAGKASGGGDGRYDAFWDAFQQNGERTEYNSAFIRDYWSADNFKPKYDLNVVNGTQMFYANTSLRVDLKQLLQDLGIELNTSGLTNAMSMFQNSRFSVIPALDFRNATNTSYCFGSCIVTDVIEKLLVSETTPFANTFATANALKEIRFEGVIAGNISFINSQQLTIDSIKNIISCLKDYTEAGTTQTLTLGETNLAKLTDEEKAIATQKGWTLA